MAILDKRKNKPEGDFYPTPNYVTQALLDQETFSGEIWENAAGQGHMAETLKNNGYTVFASDKYDRGNKEIHILDFMESDRKAQNIITNPPYNIALDFVKKSVQQAEGKTAMLLRLNFLESQKRYEFFKEYPPARIYVFSNRIAFYEGKVSKGSGAIAYAWYVWEKGNKEQPKLFWIKGDKTK